MGGANPTPFLDTFDRSRRFHLDEVRDALGIAAEVPIMECDARRRESVKDVLLSLTEEVLVKRLRRGRPVPARSAG